ncbi:MAG: type II toxin-antitoxin system RelE/ParE family toxin [Xanthobacteraceae bacterium]
MSVPVVWLDSAAADLDRILDYIEQESPQGALAMALAIRRGTDVLLGDYPEAGRVGRWRGTRELVIASTPFIVVYRLRERSARVEILRVLHGKQEWPQKGPVR